MTAERATSVQMIGRLVGFDTVSAQSNLRLIDYVQDYLRAHGVASRIVPDETGTKANLFATIGPNVPGGIALSGHTDVVPVAGQPWSTDPFVATEKGGRIYGRGTCDMKSFIAVALALVPEFQAKALRRPIHLCLSYDEETTCAGVLGVLRLLGRELPLPALAIIGEPTMMRVVNAHKGVSVQRTTITGRDGHSGAPHRGANAIVFMGRFIGRLERLAAELRAEGAGVLPPGLEFDPPWTTLNLGRIGGGTAMNIIARTCTLDWEFRLLPGVDAAAIRARLEQWVASELEPELRQAAPEGSVVTSTIVSVPPLSPEPNGVAESVVLRLTGGNRTETAAFASEAGHFQAAGISTVLCGPGSIAEAHQANEFVALEQVMACEAFLRRLADWAETS
jgi:acetylornithine deacetylase